MTTTCAPGSWGLSPYGIVPFGGYSPATPGGPLPYTSEFNIYCVGPCGEMAVFTSYDGVEETLDNSQISVDPSLADTVITSGGMFSTDTTASIFVDTGVPAQATLEVSFRVIDMPADFSDLKKSHLYIGLSDHQGACAGLFFSLVGIAYTGSVLHASGSNEIILNSAVQVLPGSLNLVPEDTYCTLRLVVDSTTSTVFIYITETAQIPVTGHQLKFILPAIPSSSCVVAPQDGTYFSVKGTSGAPVSLQLDSCCLGGGLLIPNLPPVADAGKDLAARSCTVVQLDGSASFDPEGANLIYNWRLIDGPLESSFVLPGDDGQTLLGPFSNKLYSPTAADYAASPGIAVGDVLMFEGVAHTIASTGTDGGGFYIKVEGFTLPGPLMEKSYRILRQNSISSRATAKPTFYPDVPGLYRFDLTVFDGGLFSTPSNIILNVTESNVPRGCTPDLHFLWNYLSDFWRLVENTSQLETFWGAMAQVTASELLTLWQHEYSKSLRDVQRTFQRRWLHYDLAIDDPFPEQTKVETLYGGVQSANLLSVGLPIAGTELKVSSPLFPSFNIRFVGGPGTIFTTDIATQLRKQLQAVDKRFVVEELPSITLLDISRISVRAPFPFVLEDPEGASPPSGLFTLPAANDLPRGTGGAAVGIDTYRVDRPLTGMGIREGDYLVVSGEAYKIIRVISSPTDEWMDQRLVVEDLPLAPAGTWTVIRGTKSSFLDFYNSLCSDGDVAFYEVLDKATNQLAYIPARVRSAGNGNVTCLLTEHATISAYTSQPDKYAVFFNSVYRRKRMPLDELVVEVPTLQEKIKNSDDSAVLRQNIDFFRSHYRGRNCLEFVAGEIGEPDVWQGLLPPRRMWAETTYIDNRPVVEQNFGIPASFSLDDFSKLTDNSDYLSIVRGLWYAYFNGPTLYNLRVGTQILLGLPFAEETGTIVEIREDFSLAQGRILIQDKNAQAIVRSYNYPNVLDLELNPATGAAYKVGDEVAQFAPLVKGVEVIDYIKDPRWFEGYLNQGSFFEVEKFFKFLVRVDSAAFSLSTLMFVRKFILRIKPTYTFPLFVVLRSIGETTVDTTDKTFYSGKLILNDGPCGWGLGLGMSFDDPDPSGGGWHGQYDSAFPLGPVPVHPSPTFPVPWGFDSGYLCPEDLIHGKLCTTFAVPTTPTMDSIFAYDSALFTEEFGVFEENGWSTIPEVSLPAPVGQPITAAAPTTLEEFDFEIQFNGPTATPLSIRLHVEKNSSVVQTIDLVILAGATTYASPIPLSPSVVLAPGDQVHLLISTQNSTPYSGLPWMTITAAMGASVMWAYDTALPAGTYCTYRQM